MDKRGAASTGRRFLHRRAALAGEQAEIAVEVSVERVSAVVAGAATLAERLEALPLQDDLDLRRWRQERVRRLRWAVDAGQESLRVAQRRTDVDEASNAG